MGRKATPTSLNPLIPLLQPPPHPPQRHRPQPHEPEKRQPQSMVAEPAHGDRHRQCNQHRQQHRIAHLPRPGRAYEQAVQQVTPHCNQRQQRQVGQIWVGRRPHTADVGLQVDEQVPTQQEQPGKAQAGDQRPAAGHHQRTAQGVAVTGTNGVATQGLHRMRQPVECIGSQQQAVEQQGVGGHCGLAQACALYGNQQKHQL